MSEVSAVPEKVEEPKKPSDLLKTAKDRFAEATNLHQHNIDAAREDMEFRAGNQWPAKIKTARGDKPCLTVDKTNQYVRQVVNDGRQNRPAVKVRPVDDKGDVPTAEAFQGIIRNICNVSNADEAFDTALDHAAGSGFGYFRVVTEYCHDRTFEQDIRVRRVRNPLAVRLGPHYLADGSDAEFGFFIDDVPKDRFARQWPKAKEKDWESSAFGDGWAADKTVRVCEYFYRVETRETFHLLVDATMVSDADYQKSLAELGPSGVVPIKLSREIPSYKVKWCRFTGAEVLEENDWLGKYIPIIPVYGNESDIDGKVTYSGLIRSAKDAQMLHNFMRSKFAERVALTPLAPWLISEGQIEGHKDEWEKANSGDVAALVYKTEDVNGHPVPPPRRIDPSDVPAGFAEDASMSEHDIQASMGMYAASIGEKSNEKSGKAIMARQREGDTATFHYQDNLNRAIRYLGRILVDLIPKYYDSARIVRMLGEDGKATHAQVDPRMPRASQKIGSKMVFNLGVGIYDVTLDAGPSYTTKRQEAAEAQLELVRANPAMWNTHGDLIVKSLDWPGAEEFAKRSRLTLPPEIRDAMGEEGDDTDPDVRAARAETQQIMAEAKERLAQADEMIQGLQAENESLKQQAQNKTIDGMAKLQDSETKEYEAHTERMALVAPALTPQDIAAVVTQTLQEILPQMLAGAGGSMPPPQPPPETMAPPIEEPPPGGFFTP